MADREEFIEQELAKLPNRLSSIGDGCCSLVACVPVMVRIKISRTKYKDMDIMFQFPDDYPDSLVLVEMKSKLLPERFLDSLVKAVEMKADDFVGKSQVLPITQFAVDFLDQNSLCVCAGEIANLKRKLTGENDNIKIRQKDQSFIMTIEDSGYLAEFKFIIPENYPDEKVELELRKCNFPRHFIKFFNGQAEEFARKCVEPPLLRKTKNNPNPRPHHPFVPKRSLEPVGNFLIENVKRYPTEKCSICRKNAFPEDPKDVTEVPQDPNFIDRVYCSHIYHYGCLDKYMKSPPFKGGKKCLVCQQFIYHDKWRESDQMREDRWAHEQARIREIDEVTEFLK